MSPGDLCQFRDDLADSWNAPTYPDRVGINKDSLDRLEHAVPCMCVCVCVCVEGNAFALT